MTKDEERKNLERELRKAALNPINKDGWHKLYDYEVCVENGIVTHGTKEDINGSLVSAYPYRWDKYYKCWINENVNYSTLRKGIKNGNWKLL